MPTPHDNEGTFTRKTLRWLSETEGWKASAMTSRVEDDFRQRTQYQLGKTRDPLVHDDDDDDEIAYLTTCAEKLES